MVDKNPATARFDCEGRREGEDRPDGCELGGGAGVLEGDHSAQGRQVCGKWVAVYALECRRQLRDQAREAGPRLGGGRIIRSIPAGCWRRQIGIGNFSRPDIAEAGEANNTRTRFATGSSGSRNGGPRPAQGPRPAGADRGDPGDGRGKP